MILAIDLGTSSVKAVVFDPDSAQMVQVASTEYPVDTPAPNQAEQEPERWYQATISSVGSVLSCVDPLAIQVIGLTGQMHGTVLLDKVLKPLHPAIIWADQRSTEIVDQIIRMVGSDHFLQIAGTLPAPGFMAATLAWLKQHKPDLLWQAKQVLLPKDYLRFRMTGELAAEPSDAAATALFDIRKRQWSAKLLQVLDLPVDLFPQVIESTAVAGQLLPGAAEDLGLQAGIPVVAGCADQPAQALANGLLRPGRTSVTIGTGGQVFAPVDLSAQPMMVDARVHLFNHVVPAQGYVLGAILSAGLSLRWLRDVTGLQHAADAYSILSAEAAAISPGAGGLIFLPYLVGERTPHMDGRARGAFIGLGLHHSRGHLARAVMEGVAFALRQTLEICFDLAGRSSSLILAGGGAESASWRRVQADVFGLPAQRSLQSEQTALGACMVAGVGMGIYRDLHEASGQITRLSEPTMPDQSQRALYEEHYQHFCQLFPRLRDDFHRLANQ